MDVLAASRAGRRRALGAILLAIAVGLAGFRLESGEGAPDGVTPRAIGVRVGPARREGASLRVRVAARLEPGKVAFRAPPDPGFRARARVEVAIFALERLPETAVAYGSAEGALARSLVVDAPEGFGGDGPGRLAAVPLLAGFEWRLDDGVGGAYLREIGVSPEAEGDGRRAAVRPVLSNRGLAPGPLAGRFAADVAFVALGGGRAGSSPGSPPAPPVGPARHHGSGRADGRPLVGPLFGPRGGGR